jgi:hypothetical protein
MPQTTSKAHDTDVLNQEGKAISERLWSHAVGVTNRALVTTGTDPVPTCQHAKKRHRAQG